MLRKFASALVLDAYRVPSRAGKRDLRKAAHRVDFDYDPRPGYLYVRSRMISSRCNDNHDEFPAEEIRAGWRTFIGKPVFVNHHNDDHKRARGVIIDAAVHEDRNPDGSPDLWVEGLMEVDAVRFPKLAEAIIKKRIDRTSMGCDVKFSVCSACGNKATNPAEYCQHIPAMKGRYLYKHTASGKREGTLIREICHGLSFFENSLLVEEPADPTAVFTGVDDRGMKTAVRKTAETHPDAACPSCGSTNFGASDSPEADDPQTGHYMQGLGNLGICQDCGDTFDATRSYQENLDARQFHKIKGEEFTKGRGEQRDLFKKVTPNETEDALGGYYDTDSPSRMMHERMRQERMKNFNPIGDVPRTPEQTRKRQELMLQRSKPMELPQGPIDPRHLSMLKEAVPEGIRFHFMPAEHHPSGSHHIRATLPSADGPHDVGYLEWYPHNGMVGMVRTDSEHGGQGIASALWQRAHEIANEHGIIAPRHSDVQTPSGMGWAQKVDAEPVVTPGQRPLFDAPGDSATNTSLPAPHHTDMFDHLTHDHGSMLPSSLEMAREGDYMDTVHDNLHKYKTFRNFHVHSTRRQAAEEFIPWSDRPEGAPPTDPQYFPTDRNGQATGWISEPGIGEHHPWENGSCQSCGTNMGSRERRRYDAGSVPIGLCQGCQHEQGVYTSPTQEGFVNRPEHRPGIPKTRPMIHSAPQSLSKRAELSDEEIQKGLGMPSAEEGHRDITHEKAKGLADALMAPLYEPHGGEEGYRIHQGNEGMMDLHRRYEGHDGKFDFDEGGDPYYEIDHHNPQGKKTGWQIRHYADGPNAEIRHEATPDESHDMYDIGEDTYGSGSGGLGHHIRPPSGFGHEHLKQILHDWHDDTETDSRRYLEGNDPRIRRYKQRNRLASLDTEAVVYKTPEEHPFFLKNKPKAEHIIKAFNEADEPTKKQGMRWYSDAHHIAKSLAGGKDEHAAKGAGVLAAYSPRTSWPLNLFNASRSLQDDRAVQPGEGAGIMGQHARSAQKIIDGEHHSNVFKTPKISDFAHLIEHGGDDDSGHTRVVVDRHALSVAVGRRMTDAELEKAPLASRKYYDHVADKYRAAAAVLSHHHGYDIAPHQVQAVTWLQQQKRNGALDAGDASPGAKGRTTMERNQWRKWEDHAKERMPDIDPENLHHKSPHAAGLRRQALNEVKAPEQVNTLREEECPVCSESEVYDGERCPVCGFIAPPSMFRDPDLDMAKSVDLRQDQNPNADFGPGQADPNIPGGGLIDPSQLDAQGNPMDTAGDQLAHPDQLTPNGIEQGPGTPEDGVPDLFCPACGSAFDAGQPVAVGTDTAQPNAAGPEEGAPCPNCGQATLLSQGDMEAMEGQGMDPAQDPLQGQEDPSQTGLPMEGEEEDPSGGPMVPQGDGDQDPGGDEQVPEETEDGDDAVPPGADTKKDRELDNDEEDPRRKDPKMSKATEAAVAALTQKVAVLEQQNAYLAQLAGVAPQFQEIRRRADLNNPASPIPDPGSAPAPESTEQALQSATNDNVQNPGETPGSVQGVPAELTTTPLAPGEVLDTPPATNLIDVTAPTAGTETQLPLNQTRIETDVRVDPDPLKASGPGVGGAGNDGTAFPWTMSSAQQQEAVSANRTMASIRLAKLRITAGMQRGDELAVAAQIETDRALSNEMIAHEINTLAMVTRANAGRQGRPSNLVPRSAGAAPGVQRTVPSLAPEPVIAATYSQPVGMDDLADALI
jgi:hypothetical protein